MKTAANAVDRETAKKEVYKWLDFKRISERKRIQNEDTIETMIEAFEDGILILDPESHVITQKLEFNDETNVKELKFKPRLNVYSIQRRLKKASTPDERVMSYICELTDQPPNVIGKMDSVDYGVSQNMTIFFF